MSKSSGVTFRAWRGDAFIPLVEVLLAIGHAALDRRWSLRDTEFAPGWRGSDELTHIAAASTSVPTLKLIDLVSDGIQLVDGELIGEDENRERAPLKVRSVRGDDWDVEAEDPSVVAAIRSHFADVQDLPDG